MFTSVTETISIVLSSSRIMFGLLRMVSPPRAKLPMIIWLILVFKPSESDVISQGLNGYFRERSDSEVLLKTTQQPSRIVLVSDPDVDRVAVIRKDSVNLSKDGGPRHLACLKKDDKNQPDYYSNMRGRRLTVAYNDAWPYFKAGQVSEDGRVLEPASGIENSILSTMSETLNFTYQLRKSIDGSWGNVLSNGSVTGVIGMVARSEVDLAISAVSITHNRFAVVNFLWPYHMDALTILSRAAAPMSGELAVFTPFTPLVWLCLVATTALIGPILKAVSLGAEAFLGKPPASLQTVSFNMFRSIVSQGNDLPNYLWSQRLLLVFWYVFCLIVSALYSGTLTAVLAISPYEKPIDSLSDLPRAVSQGYTVGTLAGSMMESLFREAKDGIYRDTWNLFNLKDPSKSLIKQRSDAYDKVAAEKFAFICPLLSAETISRKLGYTKFHIARETFTPQGLGFVCQKGAPLQEAFNHLILKMAEGGLIMKWEADELRKASNRNSTAEGDSGPEAIKLTHLQAAFFLLVLGYSVALFVFALEKTSHSCCF